MSPLATVVVVVVAVAIAVGVLLVLRSSRPSPWPATGLCAIACAACFTVGGATGRSDAGPDAATIAAAASGILTVVSAIVALVPKDRGRHSPALVPRALGLLGATAGAVGLVVSVLGG